MAILINKFTSAYLRQYQTPWLEICMTYSHTQSIQICQCYQMSRVKLSKEFEEDMILLQVKHLRQASLVVCQSMVNCLAKALFDETNSTTKSGAQKGMLSVVDYLESVDLGRTSFCLCSKNSQGQDQNTTNFLLPLSPMAVAVSNAYLGCYHMKKWYSISGV